MLEGEVVECESEEVLDGRIQDHLRQGAAVAGELQFGLLHVVAVQVHVATGPYEIAELQIADLGNHVGEQGVAGNVERNPQKCIATALVELAAQLAVGDIELEQTVAGRQGHLIDERRIPCAHDVATTVGILFEPFDQFFDLIGMRAIGVGP